jgi:hypothetical protein
VKLKIIIAVVALAGILFMSLAIILFLIIGSGFYAEVI